MAKQQVPEYRGVVPLVRPSGNVSNFHEPYVALGQNSDPKISISASHRFVIKRRALFAVPAHQAGLAKEDFKIDNRSRPS